MVWFVEYNFFRFTPILITIFRLITSNSLERAETTTTEPPGYVHEIMDTNNLTRQWTWKPNYFMPRWLEYYDNTTSLEFEIDNKRLCGGVLSESTKFSNVSGIWVACQDPSLSPNCDAIPPCHPEVNFDGGIALPRVRTVIITFAVDGRAILRLTTAPAQVCIDYAVKEDPFSPCEFRPVKPLSAELNFQSVQFTFGASRNTTFSGFKIQMLSRFATDVVLIDKVEAMEELLCEGEDAGADGNCVTTPTTPKPTFAVSYSTTTSTTPYPEWSTEPWGEPDTTTPPSRASSTFLFSWLSYFVLTFLICEYFPN